MTTLQWIFTDIINGAVETGDIWEHIKVFLKRSLVYSVVNHPRGKLSRLRDHKPK